jgi:TPR repeat protein
LARCYKNGNGVEKDLKKAFELFTLSTNQRNADANRFLKKLKISIE